MVKKSALVKRQKDSKANDKSDNQNQNKDQLSQNATLIQRKIREGRKKHQHQSILQSTYKFIFIFVIGLIMCIVSGSLIFYIHYLKKLNIQPLDVPKMLSSDSEPSLYQKQLLWGSYRSGIYFGMKARIQNSPSFGLMWMEQSEPRAIRHWCSQGDHMASYGWAAHDGVNFGMHETVDKNVIIKSEFLKKSIDVEGGEWTAKIRVLPKTSGNKQAISIFFYGYLDEGFFKPEFISSKLIKMSGSSPLLGNFSLVMKETHNNPFRDTLMLKVDQKVGDLKDLVDSHLELKQIQDSMYFALNSPFKEDSPNFIVNQFTVIPPFELEVRYLTDKVKKKNNDETYEEMMKKQVINFEERFEKTFNLKKLNFNQSMVSFAQSMLSNLIGGIGYFHGSSIIGSQFDNHLQDYWEAPLYTAVPSRSFFPRGFLWDEGFHNLLICQWSVSICKDIMSHWFDLINMKGWIPREQILGSEARARVPEEFVVQNVDHANPPTFFITLEHLLSSHQHDFQEHKSFFEKLFPRLKAWYQWYNSSQHSNVHFSAYYWRGRNATTTRELNPKTLTSGLDDYPRASHPSQEERHVDLRCWLAYMSKVMSQLASLLGLSSQYPQYEATYKLLSDNLLLNQLHWSPSKQRYSDWGLHTDHVVLKRPKPPVNKNLKPGQRPPPPPVLEKERVVIEPPTLRFLDSEFGYVSLFPFLLKLLDFSSSQLGKILEDLKNPNLLWTPFGLRSLARSSPTYNKFNTEHDGPYWRGAIWININFLAVNALNHYSKEGPHAEKAKQLYNELRLNLIKNIFKQHLSSGYVWEQYDDITGRGKGSHPFTGWTSLVVLLMAEKY